MDAHPPRSRLGRTPEEQKRGHGAYRAFTEALEKANAYQASGRLRPTSDATTVRVANGKTHGWP